MNYCPGSIFKPLLGLLVALSLWACAATHPPTTTESRAVNYLEVSNRLVTSGQPSAAQIAALHRHQFRLVINLAPTDSSTDFHDEAQMLGNKGIVYVAIPVEMQRPEYRDFLLFSAILGSTEESRVWVHCKINYRASLFTFLYRVIHEGADPYDAYEKVMEIWVPTTHWKKFARETLAKHDIMFDF